MSLYQYIKGLQPGVPLQIALVVAVNSDNTSTVEFPDGSRLTVRGTIVAVGAPAFIRAGVIEGVAPARTATTIEI